MRKTLSALFLATLLPTAAVMAMPAEDGPRDGSHFMMDDGPHRGGPRGPFADLDLSREQRQQIDKLRGEQMKAHHEITEKYLDKLPEADKKAMQAELKASFDKQQADIRALLTPEQQKQFDADKAKMEARRAEWKEFQAWKAQQTKK
jgi:Spy/CpxP family protein refolding chaperone